MRAIKYIFCILIVLMVSAPLFAIEGDIELLKFIADGYETNLEKIRTWGGSVIVETSNVDEGTDESIQKGSKRYSITEFLIDNDFKATRWNTRTKDVTYNEGKESQRDPFDYSGMVKSKQACQMFYDSKSEKGTRTMEILSKDDLIRTEGGFTFDPLYVWEHIFPIRKQMMMYYEHANNPIFCSGGHAIVRQGNIATFNSRINSEVPGQDVVHKFVFDLSRGCNLLELVAITPINEVRWKLDYEQIGNVFVIKQAYKSYKDKRPGNEEHSQMKVTLSNKIVNKPVDPSEFEFDKIGLRPGDKILDRTMEGLYYEWRKTTDDILEVLQDLDTTEEFEANPVQQEVPSKSPAIVQKAPEIHESDAVNNENLSGNRLASISLSLVITMGIVALLFVTGCFFWKKVAQNQKERM